MIRQTEMYEDKSAQDILLFKRRYINSEINAEINESNNDQSKNEINV